MEVANTILSQLGGNRFVMMTGSKNLTAGKDSLSFKVGKNSTKVNYVKITLNGKDLYDMEFGRIYGGKYTVISTFNDIYCDGLVKIFEIETQLYTTL